MKRIYVIARLMSVILIANQCLPQAVAVESHDNQRKTYPNQHSKEKVVVFDLLRRSDDGRFRITNNTYGAIVLSSAFPEDSKDYPFSPAIPEYQFLKKGEWTRIVYGHDTISYKYLLKAGKSIDFDIDLSMFDALPRGTSVRIKLGKHVSKPFAW